MTTQDAPRRWYATKTLQIIWAALIGAGAAYTYWNYPEGEPLTVLVAACTFVVLVVSAWNIWNILLKQRGVRIFVGMVSRLTCWVAVGITPWVLWPAKGITHVPLGTLTLNDIFGLTSKVIWSIICLWVLNHPPRGAAADSPRYDAYWTSWTEGWFLMILAVSIFALFSNGAQP